MNMNNVIFHNVIFLCTVTMQSVSNPVTVCTAPIQGLALINGTQMITALGAEALSRAETIAKQADIVAALTLDVLQGTPKAFDYGTRTSYVHSMRQCTCTCAYMIRLRSIIIFSLSLSTQMCMPIGLITDSKWLPVECEPCWTPVSTPPRSEVGEQTHSHLCDDTCRHTHTLMYVISFYREPQALQQGPGSLHAAMHSSGARYRHGYNQLCQGDPHHRDELCPRQPGTSTHCREI